jgi:hypothetical protein
MNGVGHVVEAQTIAVPPDCRALLTTRKRVMLAWLGQEAIRDTCSCNSKLSCGRKEDRFREKVTHTLAPAAPFTPKRARSMVELTRSIRHLRDEF